MNTRREKLTNKRSSKKQTVDSIQLARSRHNNRTAYLNDQSVKDFYVSRVKLHAELDEIVQGKYLGNGKGCLIGCAAHKDDGAHEYIEEMTAIPLSILQLSDNIFERLPNGDAKLLPVAFFESIPVGADLSKISRQMCVFSLNQCREFAFDDGKAAIDTVLALLHRSLNGDEPSEGEWSAARSAACLAAWSAARSAAYSAAESAYSAAESAASAAESASYSAAESAAYSAAESAAAEAAAFSAASAVDSAARLAATISQRDHLLYLLANAPVSLDGEAV